MGNHSIFASKQHLSFLIGSCGEEWRGGEEDSSSPEEEYLMIEKLEGKSRNTHCSFKKCIVKKPRL